MTNILRRLLILCAALSLPLSAAAVEPTSDILPLDQVKPGMRGVAYTIFGGSEIESFDLEVIGVLRNLIGPQQDIILIRLLGDKVNYTGVVSGMSGSPVYLDGKLAGALSLRFGFFTKEPLAGVTPIESMLRAGDAGEPTIASGEPPAWPRYPLPEEIASTAGLPANSSPYLVPIETPLVFVGFYPEVINHFSRELSQYGLLAVQGGGTAKPGAGSPLEPGGAVAAALVTGDLSIAGICTISHRVGDQLYACGHWILGLGNVELPMARAEVVTTVPSEWFSFKLGNIGEVVGGFQHDRRSAIVGRVGAAPAMVPVELTLVHRGRSHRYHYQVFQHPKFSPLLLDITVFNGLFATIESSEGMTYRMRGRLALDALPDVVLDDMFSPTDSFFSDLSALVAQVGGTFRHIFNNPFQAPKIKNIAIEVELLPDRLTASIENAWTDKSEVRPGETVMVKAVLRPYRGPRVVREIPVTIPPQASKGELRILVSDATLLNRLTSSLLFLPAIPGFPTFTPRVTSLDQLISLLNRQRRNDHLYVSIFQRTPTMLVEDKVLPSVPLSQINVLNNKASSVRPTGTLLVYDSILNEVSEPLGQVITGSHWLSLTVR